MENNKKALNVKLFKYITVELPSKSKALSPEKK